MHFHTLGGVGATRDDGEELPLGGPKQRLVLTLLLCSPGQLVTTDRLVESVWHDSPPANPRSALQVYVSNLRRLLTGVDLEHRDEGYVLHVDPSHVDAERFTELVEHGTSLVERDPGRAATQLRDALALWRGRPFGGLADEPALAVEAARLEELRLRALEARIDADLALGRHEELVGELRELVTQHRLRERFWAQLMLALYRSERQGEALEAYESARETLAGELGIDPSPLLQRLHTQVLRQDPAIDAPAAAEAASAGEAPAAEPVRGYELLEELGSGTVGTVYRGRQPSVAREVAIKIVRSELADDPEFVRCFEVEAQRVARLEHPHIVPLHDYWREPGAAYLVMRWLRGGSVAHALRGGPWSLEAAVRLLEQVTTALDYVHRQGVAHLDLKPTNVLLDPDGNAYLSDFGIARYARQPDALAGAARDGGPPYLTSEDVTGERLTPATDVFGLGLIAFELLTGRHPYAGESAESLRERVRRQPLPPLAELRPELGGEVEEVLRRATAVDPAARFARAGELAEALRDCTGVRVAAPAAGAVRNPYKGLRAFDEADAGDFFGREPLVQQLLDRLESAGRRARLVTVVGPSGSGKSSLVRAGLIPALRQGRARGSERWFVATTRPGSKPMLELERALAEIAACGRAELSEALASGADGLVRAAEAALPEAGAELLLVVDQFEELFSLAAADERRQLADQLHRAATDESGRVRVVVTLRADFYDQALLDPALGEVVAATTMAVPALSSEELERAVVEPAEAVGTAVHRDLVAQILNDVTTAPAALPLLQYALTELFDRRSGDALTLEGYHAIGGAQGALAGRAEQLYASLDPAGQRACRQLFLRLVTVADGRADIRRRVRRDELAELAELTDDATVDEVLETFGRHRLLTFDRDPATRAPTVEVAHEALLDAWDRLRGWIEQARTDLVMQQRLGAAAEEWIAAGRDEAYLLHGARLAEFDEWAPRSQVVLTEAEQELLDASREAETARRQAEREREERERRLERRSINRLRAVAVISLVAAVLAVGLSVIAVGQRNQALEQEQLATAEGLVRAAVAERDTDPELSVLLAREAVRRTADADSDVRAEAESTLRAALTASHVRRRLPSGGGLGVAGAGDGRLAVLGAGGTLTVWDADRDEPALELGGQHAPEAEGPRDVPTRLADRRGVDFAPDGSAVVVLDADRGGLVLDPATEERTALDVSAEELALPGQPGLAQPRFSPDGELVAAAIVQEEGGGTAPRRSVGVWDAATGGFVQWLFGHSRNVRSHAFSPEGDRVATVAADGLRVWDVATGDPVRLSDTGDPEPTSVAFGPEGERLAVGVESGAVLLLDAEEGNRLGTLTGHTSPAVDVAFNAAGDQLVAASHGTARVWDADTREELFVLRGHRGWVTEAAFTADGARVATTGLDGTTRLWDVSVEGGYELAGVPAHSAAFASPDLAFNPAEPHQLAVTRGEPAVEIRDVSAVTEARALSREGDEVAHTVAYSGDGGTVAAAVAAPPSGPVGQREAADRVLVWDVAAGELRDAWTRLGGLADGDLALSRGGSRLATAGEDGSLRLRGVGDGAGGGQGELHRHDAPLTHVEFTPDDERLVVGARDAAFVVATETGEVAAELAGVDGAVSDIAVVDDEQAAVAEAGGGLAVFDLDTGERDRAISETAEVASVDVEGGLLALARGRSVTVRDFPEGGRRFTVHYDDRVERVRLSPDGRYLATAPDAEWAHLHVTGREDLLELTRERVTRSFTAEERQEYLE